jgi:hypothetical protein
MRSPEIEFSAASGELGRFAHPEANDKSASTQKAFAKVLERGICERSIGHLRFAFCEDDCMARAFRGKIRKLVASMPQREMLAFTFAAWQWALRAELQ